MFKVKYTPTNEVDRYKARLVARGFAQRYGIDYEETFSPTLRTESLRMLLAFAARHGLLVDQMDVPNAYLKGELWENIYMEVPEGMTMPPRKKNHVLHLRKGLYGLKQAGREWNENITKFLISIGYRTILAINACFTTEPRVSSSLYTLMTTTVFEAQGGDRPIKSATSRGI